MAEVDFLNKTFGIWDVLSKSGTDLYRCKCSICGFERDIRGYNLKKKPPNCKHDNGTSFNHRKQSINTDILNKIFGELTVIEKLDNGFVKCQCSCGEIKIVHRRYLLDGTTTSCGHDKVGKTSKLIDITGKTFGNWYVDGYYKDSLWVCQCIICGRVRNLRSHLLRGNEENRPKCICQQGNPDNLDNLVGETFGEWEVLKVNYRDKTCLCKCSCGNTKNVRLRDLRNGTSKSCGHNTTGFKDLTGQRFGEWNVISKSENQGLNGETLWKCKCDCGVIKDVSGYALRHGNSKSCGHNTTGFKDLTNQTFGELKVIEYLGNSKWLCQCSCTNTTIVSTYNLTKQKIQSCGCKASDLRRQANLNNLGVPNPAQIHRSTEQINITSSKENLQNFIESLGYKPRTLQLCDLLNLQPSRMLKIIHEFNLDSLVDIGNSDQSRFEDEINSLFPCDNRHNRTILNGKEIDFYYPDKQFGIEFNGNYWHSDLNKPAKYHQEKTAQAGKMGIQLLHIFEYEWENHDTKEKLINLIKRKLNPEDLVRVYARNCEIREIDSSQSNEFLEKYHLQGKATSSINIGCFLDKELLGVMTFGKPRFNSNYEYELIRLVWKNDIIVVGGSQRLLGYFKSKYNPNSIITYCDISKFTGSSYLKMGFQLKDLTVPNYKWVNYKNDVLPRYKTTKQSLINKGLGNPNQTEAEIMSNLGYFKIYDCGNFVFIWMKQ